MFIGKRNEFLRLNDSIQTEFSQAAATAAHNSWRRLVSSDANGLGVEDLIHFLVESVRAHVGPGTEFYDLATESVRVRHKQLSSGFEVLERDTIAPAGKALLLTAASALGEATEITKQALVLGLINDNAKAYDGIPFFGTGHFVNYKDSSQGTYDNAETGKDLTADNLAAAIGAIEDRRMADGSTPRMLKPKYLLHAPALKKKAHDATGVQFGESTSSTRSTFGVLPLSVPGLAKVGGKDVWIVTAELQGGSPLSRPFGVSTLVPPHITDFSGITDSHLERMKQLQYVLAGDLNAYLGHPYLAHRCAVA